MTATEEQYLEKSISFLREIGIDVSFTENGSDSFLPGIVIENGRLIINKETLLYPGDILHEAGHIAVMPASERSTLNAEAIGASPNRDAEEMSAIAWSYAAAKHLEIDPRFVFHDFGYKGGGSSILSNFEGGYYFAVPFLQWIGLTLEDKNAAVQDLPPYPHMIKWLRD